MATHPRAHRRRDTVVALIGAAALALGLAGLRAQAQAPLYSATPLGSLPGGISSYANAINASGQVAGSSYDGSHQRAFRWQNGVMTDLGTLGGTDSGAIGINDAGQVVGWSTTATGDYHAFVWQNGMMTDPGTLGGSWSWPSAIDDTGRVVGASETASGSYHVFLWQNGVMSDLGTLDGAYSQANAINDAGQVVGGAETASGAWHAFLWQNGVMTDLGTLGGSYSFAYAINDAGQFVGVAETAGGAWHAFLWQNGVMTDLGTLGGQYTEAYDINDAGQVVGYSETPKLCDHPDGARPDYHAVRWENGVIHDLHAIDCEFTWATAINSAGQIIGLIDGRCYSEPDGTICYPSLFVYSAGVLTDLNDVLPGPGLGVSGINDCGQIAANRYPEAYRLDPAVITGGAPGSPGKLTAAHGNTATSYPRCRSGGPIGGARVTPTLARW